jgi:hypothetical protein
VLYGTDTPEVFVVITVTFAGHIRLGCCTSLTITVKVQLAVLLAASVAVQVTVVVPLLKAVPLAGAQVTVTGPSQTSLAVGAV